MSALDRFSEATRAWFTGAFVRPTPAQDGAWDAISSGEHALVVAPTGSGKTLAAFLWSLDRLAAAPPPADEQQRCRVLYVSPLKALAVDVERNLRAPLTGIGQAAARLGLARPEIRVGIRSGDTPADERRAMARRPPDILITTPESLFLLLTSSAREALRGIETVIVDEVHAVADSKRGAHLAVSLDRLDELLDRPAQRIGLSATVRPIEEVATYLAGGRPVRIVAPPSQKEWDLSVVVPVEDMSELGQPTGELEGSAAGNQPRTSIWPAVEERVLDLVQAHRSTIVFANSRRLAERLTSRLNELAYERATGETVPPGTNAAGADGAGRLGRRHPRGHPAGRGGAPRLGVPRAARDRRGGAEVRPAARRRRHLEPRARHRHGRGRPRRAGRGAAHRRLRPAAGRPGRAPGRRGQPRRAVPEVPRRPGAVRAGRRADEGRRDRVDPLPAQPARRAGPADRRDGLRAAAHRRRGRRRSCAGRRRSPRCRTPRCTGSSTCSPAATPPTRSPSCGRG